MSVDKIDTFTGTLVLGLLFACQINVAVWFVPISGNVSSTPLANVLENVVAEDVLNTSPVMPLEANAPNGTVVPIVPYSISSVVAGVGCLRYTPPKAHKSASLLPAA